MPTRTHRFQSPFEHWISGLLFEFAIFSAYLIALAGILWAAVLIGEVM